MKGKGFAFWLPTKNKNVAHQYLLELKAISAITSKTIVPCPKVFEKLGLKINGTQYSK